MPLTGIQAYYYCSQNSQGQCAITKGIGTNHRCNPTANTICNTLQSAAINGTLPLFSLKSVYQIQIGMLLGCFALTQKDQVQSSCMSPDPIP